jgi:peroxiredoxin
MRASDPFPDWSWPKVGGGKLAPARVEGWRMLVVYRGKHCGLCKKYLGQLESMRADFEEARISVFALSADPGAKAEAQVREGELGFEVAYDLQLEQMRELGLYVSPPTGKAERPFAEPGVFVLNPQGLVQVANISNAPFARPELKAMLEGIETARKEGAPIHGTF